MCWNRGWSRDRGPVNLRAWHLVRGFSRYLLLSPALLRRFSRSTFNKHLPSLASLALDMFLDG